MAGPAWVCLGRIVRPHGLRGEVRIDVNSGDPEGFKRLERAALSSGGEPLKILSAMTHKRQAIVRFAGYETIEAAAPLIGREVWAERDWLPKPQAGAYYWVDLAGCKLTDLKGRELGEVTGLENGGAHDNLIVRLPDGREGQVPFVDAMVKTVDLQGRKITVDVPPGLLEEEDET